MLVFRDVTLPLFDQFDFHIVSCLSCTSGRWIHLENVHGMQQCMWLSRLWFQQMFNWWWDRWFGILGVPPSNNPFHKGIPGIQTTIFIYLGSIIKINPMYIFIIPKYILYIFYIYIYCFLYIQSPMDP